MRNGWFEQRVAGDHRENQRAIGKRTVDPRATVCPAVDPQTLRPVDPRAMRAADTRALDPRATVCQAVNPQTLRPVDPRATRAADSRALDPRATVCQAVNPRPVRPVDPRTMRAADKRTIDPRSNLRSGTKDTRTHSKSSTHNGDKAVRGKKDSACIANKDDAVIDFKAIQTMRHLLRLDLSASSIQKIPMLDLPRLEDLQLDHNELVTTTGLLLCTSLRTLNFGHNKIRSVTMLEMLAKLETLDLSHNCIRSPEHALRTLSLNLQLSVLYVSGNPCASSARYWVPIRNIIGEQLAWVDSHRVGRSSSVGRVSTVVRPTAEQAKRNSYATQRASSVARLAPSKARASTPAKARPTVVNTSRLRCDSYGAQMLLRKTYVEQPNRACATTMAQLGSTLGKNSSLAQRKSEPLLASEEGRSERILPRRGRTIEAGDGSPRRSGSSPPPLPAARYTPAPLQLSRFLTRRVSACTQTTPVATNPSGGFTFAPAERQTSLPGSSPERDVPTSSAPCQRLSVFLQHDMEDDGYRCQATSTCFSVKAMLEPREESGERALSEAVTLTAAQSTEHSAEQPNHTDLGSCMGATPQKRPESPPVLCAHRPQTPEISRKGRSNSQCESHPTARDLRALMTPRTLCIEELLDGLSPRTTPRRMHISGCSNGEERERVLSLTTPRSMATAELLEALTPYSPYRSMALSSRGMSRSPGYMSFRGSRGSQREIEWMGPSLPFQSLSPEAIFRSAGSEQEAGHIGVGASLVHARSTSPYVSVQHYSPSRFSSPPLSSTYRSFGNPSPPQLVVQPRLSPGRPSAPFGQVRSSPSLPQLPLQARGNTSPAQVLSLSRSNSHDRPPMSVGGSRSSTSQPHLALHSGVGTGSYPGTPLPAACTSYSSTSPPQTAVKSRTSPGSYDRHSRSAAGGSFSSTSPQIPQYSMGLCSRDRQSPSAAGKSPATTSPDHDHAINWPPYAALSVPLVNASESLAPLPIAACSGRRDGSPASVCSNTQASYCSPTDTSPMQSDRDSYHCPSSDESPIRTEATGSFRPEDLSPVATSDAVSQSFSFQVVEATRAPHPYVPPRPRGTYPPRRSLPLCDAEVNQETESCAVSPPRNGLSCPYASLVPLSPTESMQPHALSLPLFAGVSPERYLSACDVDMFGGIVIS